MLWQVDFLVARWFGGDMTVNSVKIAVLGTALHVHHTFWDIYLPPLNYFDVLNFREKKFFAKLGSVLLFNSLFSNSVPTLRLHIPRSSCGVRSSTRRHVYCYFLCSIDTPERYSTYKYLRMIARSNLRSSVCIFLGSCWAILGHFL